MSLPDGASSVASPSGEHPVRMTFMPSKPARHLLRLALVISLFTAFNANAIILGELRSSSRLGQLLHAEIDVEEEPGDRFEASCVKLYKPAQATAEMPWITEARLRFQRENGKGKLYISADHPLRDPVVQIGLQSTCPGGRVWRDYTLLVSPLDAARRETVAPVAAARSARPAIPNIPAREGGRGSRAAPVKLATAEPAQRLATEIAPAPRKPGRVARISLPARDDEPLLQMSSALSAPVSPGEAARDILRLQYQLLMALPEQVDSQLVLAEKMLRAEQAARELSATGKRLEFLAAQSEAVPVPLPVPVAPSPIEKSAASAALPVVPDVVAPRVIAKARPETVRAQIAETMIDWPLYAGLGATALLLALFAVRRRRAAAAREVYFLPPHAPAVIADEPDFAASTPGAVAAPLAVIDALPVAAPAVPQDIPPAPEKLEASPVLELAEIMLSFGRVSGAAQALQEYIEANPKEALQPWIRLLEIYRENGMRADFEKLAANLNQNFNVEIVHWDSAAPGERVEMTLELLPHIRQQIDAMWGSPACLEYLQKLLHDNRNGTRNGFALPVVKEILLLIDLMVAEKTAAC